MSENASGYATSSGLLKESRKRVGVTVVREALALTWINSETVSLDGFSGQDPFRSELSNVIIAIPISLLTMYCESVYDGIDELTDANIV